MKKILCSLVLVGMVGALATPATAATTATHHHAKAHHTAHHTTKKKAAKTKASKSDERVKTAQTHLIHLSYLKDKPDGIMGSKTKAALKKFQQHNNLKPDGKLTDATFKALEVADPAPEAVKAAEAAVVPTNVATAPTPPAALPDFYTKHPDFYGYYDQQHENAMQLGPPTVPSRYGRVDVHERTDNDSIGYDVTINDQPLFLVEDQPSVIGISRTFSLDSEDVVIFNTYRAQSSLCMYKSFLLVLNAEGTKTLEIPNCTRGYQAKALRT